MANGKEVPPKEQIDILISTDVLSEGQNLQDCGAIINYDLTWNPIRLVQRNGRIDRIGSPHTEIGIYNMFPEEELEELLHLVERLTSRISTIDDLGLLDASVLGEVVHPRTFNTLRRIRAEDGAVLDEEEARAELAGPEMLLKHLKEVLNREGGENIADLPNGIHSGLRRQKCYGMFFYFQAPRDHGRGPSALLAIHRRPQPRDQGEPLRDRPAYRLPAGRAAVHRRPGRVRLAGEGDRPHPGLGTRSGGAGPRRRSTVDPIQQTVAEELKDALRRQTVDRESGQERASAFSASRWAVRSIVKLRKAHEAWSRDTRRRRAAGGRQCSGRRVRQGAADREGAVATRQEDLELICFEYVTG